MLGADVVVIEPDRLILREAQHTLRPLVEAIERAMRHRPADPLGASQHRCAHRGGARAPRAVWAALRLIHELKRGCEEERQKERDREREIRRADEGGYEEQRRGAGRGGERRSRERDDGPHIRSVLSPFGYKPGSNSCAFVLRCASTSTATPSAMNTAAKASTCACPLARSAIAPSAAVMR